MAAKLSCLVWSPHPGAAPYAYVADYDGEVTQMDLSTGHFLSSVDGHCGRRCDSRPPHTSLLLASYRV